MKNWKKPAAALALSAATLLHLSAPALAAGWETAASGTTPSGLTLANGSGGGHYAYLSGDNGYFNPNGNMTRAEAAQILTRLLSAQPAHTVSYTDVAPDAWYAQAAGTMGALGVLRAGQTAFLPDEQITRGEFIHAVACFFPANASGAQFSDVTPGDPNWNDYLTARSLGWLSGFEDGTLRPGQPLTRAEAVAMLNRALGRSPDRSYIDGIDSLLYLDVGKDQWYYYDVMEASVPHQHTTAAGAERWTSHIAMSAPVTLQEGFSLVDGWLCYYDKARGGMVRNDSVGSFTFDADGHFTSGSADLDKRLREIVRSKTDDSMTQEQKLRALYVYTRDSFTYLRRPAYDFGVTDFMQKDALDILTTGYGNCYSYASLFWYLSRWIGYDAKIYSGTVGTNKRPHSWVEINFDGKDYIFDTELEMAYHKKGRYEINLYKYIDVDNWVYIK